MGIYGRVEDLGSFPGIAKNKKYFLLVSIHWLLLQRKQENFSEACDPELESGGAECRNKLDPALLPPVPCLSGEWGSRCSYSEG